MIAMRRGMVALTTSATILVASGCAPTVDADDWVLEPISWESRTLGDVDVSFGMSTVAADGAGGFWSGSAGSWLHVGADGETLARFNIEVEHPLHGIGHIAALSPTEMIAVRTVNEPDAAPGLSIVDMETLDHTDVPKKPLPESGTSFRDVQFGDFIFGDIAIQDSDVYVVRYQPVYPSSLDFEILRIDPRSGDRVLLHREPFTPGDESMDPLPTLPAVDLDVDAQGRIYVATPSYRLVLAPDGSELSRATQSATRPIVTVRPDGLALWWGGAAEPSTVESIVSGGSAEARVIITNRQSCDGQYRQDALRVTHGEKDAALPFLCGVNAAAWTGDSWVAAIGGEGDGVLVRLTPPIALD